jgi:uncharacterized membrane protein
MAKGTISRFFRRPFVTGMIVIVPIWVTVLVIRALVKVVDNTFRLLPPVLHPKTYLGFFGVELLISILFIFLVGIITNNFIGKRILDFGETMLVKIPIIKTIYNSVKRLTTGIVSEKKIFSRVVLLEFPFKGLSLLGFVTGEDKEICPADNGEKMLKIFIPTTPNPTTGFFCIIPESEIKYLDLTVDEAFKMIISVGYSNLELNTTG